MKRKKGFNSKGPWGGGGVVPWPLDIKGVPLKGDRPKDGCRPIIALDQQTRKWNANKNTLLGKQKLRWPGRFSKSSQGDHGGRGG